jgi:tetratricopeptide (TPR) repeat protein
MAVYYCNGWACERLISVSTVPGGNPVALRDPEHFAVDYFICEDCKRMFCDRCVGAKGALFSRPRCPDCHGRMLDRTKHREADSRPWPEAILRYNDGYALGSGGNLPAALAEYDTAVRLRPEFVLAHYRRGLTLRDLGRTDEALTALERAARLDPGRAVVLFDVGTIHLGLRQWAEAVRAFDRATAAQPRYVAAHINRAFALLASGRAEQALAASERAIRIEEAGEAAVATAHASAIAHRAKGFALLNLRRYADAVAALDVAVDTGPDDPNTYRNRAAALAALGRHEEARNDHLLAEQCRRPG